MRRFRVWKVVAGMKVRQLFCRHRWTNIKVHYAVWNHGILEKPGYVDQVCVKCLKYREDTHD